MLSVAAVDVGSNAIRLAIARVGPAGLVLPAQTQRYALRLGADVFSGGRLRPATVRRLLEVFADIAARLERIDCYRAVATSAMRDAENGAQIAALIRERSGVTLEVISGTEEGRLARAALVRAGGELPRGSLLVDLGGGSLELTKVGQRRGVSLPIGSVRLLRRHPWLGGRLSEAQLERARRLVVTELERRVPRPGRPRLAVGTGGALEILAKLAPAAGKAPGIDLAALPALTAHLARLSPKERMRRYGLRQDRADVIVPAALCIEALSRRFALRTFVVPGTGLREGILHDLAAEARRPKRAAKAGAGELRRVRK